MQTLRASFCGLILSLIPILLSSPPAFAQATRTWVSSVGDDANPCSRTAPCKTFAGAISKTAANGEINCIDPGGFGAVTITKSITIDCKPFAGGILSAGTNAINIAATAPAGVLVVLRNLDIQGAGTGLGGIRWLAASGALRIDNVRINGITAAGIDFSPTGASELFVGHVDIFNIAANTGIRIRPTGSASTVVTVAASSLQNNQSGIIVDSTATTGLQNVTIRDTAISGNATDGVFVTAGARIAATIDYSSATGNGTGVRASGDNATVSVVHSIITSNDNGLVFTSGGKINSLSSNFLGGNFSTNNSPSNTFPQQ